MHILVITTTTKIEEDKKLSNLRCLQTETDSLASNVDGK